MSHIELTQGTTIIIHRNTVSQIKGLRKILLNPKTKGYATCFRESTNQKPVGFMIFFVLFSGKKNPVNESDAALNVFD